MNEPVVKKLGEISEAEWLDYKWHEITRIQDEERSFLRGYALTPEERASMRDALGLPRVHEIHHRDGIGLADG